MVWDFQGGVYCSDDKDRQIWLYGQGGCVWQDYQIILYKINSWKLPAYSALIFLALLTYQYSVEMWLSLTFTCLGIKCYLPTESNSQKYGYQYLSTKGLSMCSGYGVFNSNFRCLNLRRCSHGYNSTHKLWSDNWH